MTDILRRGLSPVTDEAWAEIDEQAKRILKGNLSARSLVDMHGPEGWELAAVNLGKLKRGNSDAVKGVEWGVRQVLPVVEIRVPFSLKLDELDSITRGAMDPDLDPVDKAARQAALFEETAVYKGFDPACIQGIAATSANKPVPAPKDAGSFVAAVEAGMLAIQSNGIGGPFNLVLGRKLYQMLSVGEGRGYPLEQRARELLGGRIAWSPAIETGLLMSGRGGDFEFTLGQDFSIGYAGHDANTVKAFIAESFTFRVLEPAAAVELKAGK